MTDRCNFRCVYCMPEEGAPVCHESELLTAEEIVRIVRIASELGMTKIRLTGGEPLVRKDIAQIVSEIAALPGLADLSMTTNGYLLGRYADDLAHRGLQRVNISLDTLRPERFARIARRGTLEQTLAGIEAAISAGLTPLKLNCVVMRGWNEDEVVAFAHLTQERPIDVRFIELMPINWAQGEESAASVLFPGLPFPQAVSTGPTTSNKLRLYALSERDSFQTIFHGVEPPAPSGQLNASQMRLAFVSSDETRRQIEACVGSLEPAHVRVNGPARSYRIPGATGTVSFISQITNDMCLQCNRLRLTSDGQLRPCLMADGEVDLRALLRCGSTDAEIADRFRLTVLHKPKEHRLEDGLAPVGRNMSQLGG